MLRRARSAYETRDRGDAALRRAIRSAVVQPGAFALALKVLHSPQMALFAAFGSFANLLFVEFRGPLGDRLRAQVTLVVVGAALSTLGTVCSRSVPLAVVAMTVLGMAVLFSAVVSSVLASATTSLLLGFILPVALPAPDAAIPTHLAGWGIAGGLSLVAIVVLPAPGDDPLTAPVLAAIRALVAVLRAAPGDAAARATAAEAVGRLSAAFLATPWRPTGLTTAARAEVRLVDELGWVGRIVQARGTFAATGRVPAADAVRLAIATALERAGEALGSGGGLDGLTAARGRLSEAVRALPGATVELATPREGATAAGLVSALDPTFGLAEVAFMVQPVCGNVEVVVAEAGRGWVARLLGRQPEGFEGRLASARERAGAHLTLSSATTRSALRGGAALGLAVLVARLTGAQHAFWVSLGTLAVLRSNALATGQSYVRALAGTVVGLLVGAAIVVAVGTDRTVLWAVLPVAVLVAGVAPATISFAAGQAAFTVVLVIVFNLIHPAGLALGVVRIEDVALGGGASLVVGLLFWPRGAGAELGGALADAYRASAAYLAAAVDHGVGAGPDGNAAAGARGAHGARGALGARSEATAAAAANRRLDDTRRTYLAERGPKRLPMAGVTALVSGPTFLRLSADAVVELWRDADGPAPDRVAAAARLTGSADRLRSWYGTFAAALLRIDAVPGPAPGGAVDEQLATAVADDLRSGDRARCGDAVRIIWTGDHLDAARRLGDALTPLVGRVDGSESG